MLYVLSRFSKKQGGDKIMITDCSKVNYVLSSSKLNLYSNIPMLLEYTTEAILVATTNNKLEKISKISADDFEYSILYAQDEDTLYDFLHKMHSNNIRVGIIHISNPLFEEMLKYGNGATWYSACRNGIFSYLPLIQKYATKPTTILCFDNDAPMVEQAKTMCANTTIDVYKCVAHSICSCSDYDAESHSVRLYGGHECYLYFPPEAQIIKSSLYNPVEAMSKRAQLRFSESIEEFSFYTKSKLIDVNALHTMICALTYVKGSQKGFSLSSISNMHFGELLDKSTIQTCIIELHSDLFDKHLQAIAMKIGECKEFHSKLAYDFIEYLFTSDKENVGRGLDCSANSYDSKLKRHLPLLNSAENAYTNQILSRFCQLLQM